MHSGTLVFAAVVVFSASCLADPPSSRINEVMACNVTILADEDGDFSDWIELYNPQCDAVSLLGYALSDDPDDCLKWVFPDTSIPGGGFILIFASGKDRRIPGSELHANFRIRAEGERLSLVDPLGEPQDILEPVAIPSDISLGRVPDGGAAWIFLEPPTPGASNGPEPPPARTSSPEFTHSSGFYPTGISVSISSADSGATIYYTRDGTTPTDTSAVYSGPISLTQATVIRAISKAPGLLPSLPVSRSYMVDFETELPTISIIAEPEDLWSDSCGIYVPGPNAESDPPHWGANYWQDWEIPVDVDFFEPNQTLGFSQHLGMKIHGGWSRVFPQKSLRLTARDEYGDDRIEYPLFPSEPIFAFKSVILRNSGNDWHYTMIRDALLTGLTSGSDIGIQAYRPVVVFLNGAYWGIHNMRERQDEHYLSAHYGVSKDSIDLIESNAPASSGDRIAYSRLLALVENGDLSQPGVFDSVQSLMDVENFIRYMVFEIYFDNIDWPWHNIRRWRPRRPDGRFQWLLYDTDMAFGLFQSDYRSNLLTQILDPANDPWEGAKGAPVILRALLQNDEFRTAFVVRFSDLMNLFLEADTVLERMERMEAEITPEMTRHRARWYPDLNWNEKMETLREFACLRREHVAAHLRQEFGVAQEALLTLEQPIPHGGRVFINGFQINGYPWRGNYFAGLPVELRAEAFHGHEFVGWDGAVTATSDSLLFLMPSKNAAVRACFAPVDYAHHDIVITEINYHSLNHRDPGDWIELSLIEGEIDLSGWIIRDEDNTHGYVIPENTELAAGRCAVVVADCEAFEAVFPTVEHLSAELGFNLSNGGDQVRLYAAHGGIVDSVPYDDREPWPVQADGDGATLQLIDVRYPNEIARNWQASTTLLGDPGIFYAGSGGGADRPAEIPSSYRVIGVSPNPFRTEASISLTLARPSRLCVKAHDIGGRLVRILADGYHATGSHRIHLGGAGLASGTYFIRVHVDGADVQICPVVLLR